MTSHYFNELDAEARVRYKQKLEYNGQILPDPLDESIKLYVFKKHMKLWPTVSFGDIYMYLVQKECSYTNEHFRNYKGLECYNYALSGKVNNISMYRNEDAKVCVLVCDVQASQTIKKVHTPWVVTECNGNVLSGHCTCMAGLGEVCSHVAALLLTIEMAVREGLNTPSPTSLACVWNKSVKKVTPVPALQINFRKKQRVPKNSPQYVVPKLPSSKSYEILLASIKKYQPTCPFLTAISDGEETSTASEGEQEEKDINCIPNIIDHFKSVFQRLPKNSSFTDKVSALLINMQLPEGLIEDIECVTRDQSENPEWLHQRKGRLTASLFGSVLRSKKSQGSLVMKIMGNSNPFTNEATRWGRNNEAMAKMQFLQIFLEQHVNGEILPTGLLVDKEFTFLGATPDGKVNCDCCETALIEIKCPFRGKGKKIAEIINTPNFFLGENFILKQNHVYYDQVQGQLNIWGARLCYFVTYTDIDIHVQMIDFDEDYWGLQKTRLVNFYEEYVIPEILKC